MEPRRFAAGFFFKPQAMPPQHYPPTLHLICGLPGAGKTVLAKTIAASTDAFRFEPDEWIRSIWGDKAETEGNQYRDQIEQLQWKIALHALRQSTDVIIEWGTWGRSEREKLRDDAKALGARVKLYCLNAPRELLKQRILNRNHQPGPSDFLIPDPEIEIFLDDCFRQFQPPTAEELASYDEVAWL
jgi:predicted kinase